MRLDIENMSNYQILNYILKASYAEKKEIFEDNKIYAYILKSENIYIFNSLLESLEGKEILDTQVKVKQEADYIEVEVTYEVEENIGVKEKIVF